MFCDQSNDITQNNLDGLEIGIEWVFFSLTLLRGHLSILKKIYKLSPYLKIFKNNLKYCTL